MAEQKTNMTDEQLAQGLRKSKGGKLGGYGGGVWRKQFLLDLEQKAAGRR